MLLELYQLKDNEVKNLSVCGLPTHRKLTYVTSPLGPLSGFEANLT